MDPKSRFTSCAEAYAAHRPTYGEDVVTFVLQGLGSTPCIADLGAGTGISSRLLAARGARVLAIEPNKAMRERGEAVPGVAFVDGTAERTTLGEASVDAATAFQAFHWFANEDALAEIRRVVRPGGQASLALNERDANDPFTANYGDIVRTYALDDTERRRMESMDVFRRLGEGSETREFSNEQMLDREGLIGRTRSTSYLPHDGPSGASLEKAVHALFGRFAVEGYVRLALTTWVVKVELP